MSQRRGQIGGVNGVVCIRDHPCQCGLGAAMASMEGNFKISGSKATGETAEDGDRRARHVRREEHRAWRVNSNDHRRRSEVVSKDVSNLATGQGV